MGTGSKIAIAIGIIFILCVICIVVGVLLYSSQKTTTQANIEETVIINQDEGEGETEEEEDESVSGNIGVELPAVENQITFISNAEEMEEDVFVGDELGDDLLLAESV